MGTQHWGRYWHQLAQGFPPITPLSFRNIPNPFHTSLPTTYPNNRA